MKTDHIDMLSHLHNPDGTHGLSEMYVSKDRLDLTMVPWANEKVQKTYRFEQFKLVALDSSHSDPEDMEMPFDIIGMHGSKNEDDLWEFCLHCDAIDIVFVAQWPTRIDDDVQP